MTLKSWEEPGDEARDQKLLSARTCAGRRGFAAQRVAALTRGEGLAARSVISRLQTFVSSMLGSRSLVRTNFFTNE